jgi:hypothetical protein
VLDVTLSKWGSVMIQHELLIRLNEFFQKFKHHATFDEIDQVDFDGVDNYIDDLPLTINRDPGPKNKFYSIENSEILRRQ